MLAISWSTVVNEHMVLGQFFLKAPELILESLNPALSKRDFIRCDFRLCSCHSGILSRQDVVLALLTLLFFGATLYRALLGHHDHTLGHRDFLLPQSELMLQQ